MTQLVTYSRDPGRVRRHVLAIEMDGRLLLRPDLPGASEMGGAQFAMDAARKLSELRALRGAGDLSTWLRRQGVAVGVFHVQDPRAPADWFRLALPSDSEFVYDIQHQFSERIPTGWFVTVAEMAAEVRAAADHPHAGARAVRCLVRRPILQPLDPGELDGLRRDIRARLDDLEKRQTG
jgi:hypothetical protein